MTSSRDCSSTVLELQPTSPKAQSGFSPFLFWPSSFCETDVSWWTRLSKPLDGAGTKPGSSESLRQVDTMLAKYIRAQLALAGLSFVFYSVSMLILRFPYAIALGVLGGALEFLPAVGWIASAVAILTIGFLTHAHWIWMAGLLVLWRLVQDYVNSPRIMGDSLELQPLTVVFALMVGGQLGGIAGLYLSVPAVAVLRIVWLESLSTRNSATSLSTNAAKRGDTLAVAT